MKINRRLIVISLLTLLSACAEKVTVIDVTNLQSLESAEYTGTLQGETTGGISMMRRSVLEDTAMSLAAQGGLIWESTQIDNHLQRDKWYLDSIYNFNGMMLSHGVLPPVLQEGRNTINLDDPNTIRVSDRTYKILAQARFASTPPNWREYLWLSFPKPDVPARFLLPRTREERVIWANAVNLGWTKGIQQGNNIFQQSVARLNRDFQGMILYRKLLAQHLISAPYVSRTELGITGDGSDMRVNDQILRITVLPQLQTDPHGWRPIVVKNDQ